MASPPPPQHVVILGGGLTGLSAAFHLARLDPAVRITLLEKDTRMGGWVRSDRVDVRDDDGNTASILLEAGPRTVRANTKSVLELIHLLHLEPQTITTPRSSPAARARFLHVPPTPGLLALPSSLWSLLTSPLSRIILPALLLEPFRPANRPAGATDESLDAFLARRFGPAFARVLGSAFCHGVYGADARVLSVRAAFPALWDAEDRGNGSVLLGELGWRAWWTAGDRRREREAREREEAWELSADPAFVRRVDEAAVISFRDGLEQLVRALVAALERNPRVELRRGAEVVSLRPADDGHSLEVRVADDPAPLAATHVISALPLPALAPALPPSAPLPHLLANTSSTMHVFTLVFATARLAAPLHPPGFGYLVPRPARGYAPAAPAPAAADGGAPDFGGAEKRLDVDVGIDDGPGLLGVVFDTASLAEQDAPTGTSAGARAPPFVKLTAMLGGPYPHPPSSPHLALSAVLASVARQLGHPSPSPPSTSLSSSGALALASLPPPVHAHHHTHARCIPTYAVGHAQRMAELRAALRRAPWGGRLQVVGAGVGGVSVGDCVKGGREAARGLVAGWAGGAGGGGGEGVRA